MIDYAMIEPTTVCNLNCATCYRKDSIRKKELNIGTITKENIALIHKKLPNLKHIRFHGMGELFILKNHVEIVTLLRNLYPNAWIELVTNGNYNDTDEEIISKSINKLTFSIDSSDKEEYEKIRIGSSYELMINNLKKFIKIPNFQLEINYVWSSLNTYSLETFISDMGELGVKIIRVNIVQDWGNHLTDKEKLSDNFMVLKNIWNKAKKMSEKYNILLTLMGNDHFETNECEWMNRRIFITFDGNILPCCMRQYRNESLGNIYEKEVNDIWISEEIKRGRDNQMNHSGFCDKCPYIANKGIIKKLIN